MYNPQHQRVQCISSSFSSLDHPPQGQLHIRSNSLDSVAPRPVYTQGYSVRPTYYNPPTSTQSQYEIVGPAARGGDVYHTYQIAASPPKRYSLQLSYRPHPVQNQHPQPGRNDRMSIGSLFSQHARIRSTSIGIISLVMNRASDSESE
jgi:hypothetical protein